jgi:outer membrane protein
MNRKFLAVSTLATCLVMGAIGAQAQVPSSTRVAIIDIQTSVARTQEGQKLLRELQEKYKPKEDALQQKRSQIATLQEQLGRGANTMSDDARRQLERDVQQRQRDLQREAEDAQTEFGQEQQQTFNQVGSKLMTVIDKYAKEKGFSIVLDISSPQSPVLYAVNEVNITNDIILLYDQDNPQAAAASDTGASSGSAAAKPAQP